MSTSVIGAKSAIAILGDKKMNNFDSLVKTVVKAKLEKDNLKDKLDAIVKE